MGPAWALSAPDRPHMGPIKIAISVGNQLHPSFDSNNSTHQELYIRLDIGHFVEFWSRLVSQGPSMSFHWRWCHYRITLISRFMGPTWGPSGADRTQVGPMLAPWTLLSRHYPEKIFVEFTWNFSICKQNKVYTHCIFILTNAYILYITSSVRPNMGVLMYVILSPG